MIAHQRLYHQRLAPATFEKPEDVVRWMGAMQAQDYGQAVWGIGARMYQPTLLAVEKAIAEGKIIRTWPMRGTIHFVPPEDARWMLQLGAARMIAKDQRRLQQLELNDAIIDRCKAIFTEVLQEGRPISREKLMQELEDRGIKTHSGRGYHILWHVAQVGIIAIGPTENKEQTFVLMEKWVPNPRQLAPDEALVELARRYFTSHGPATVHDFAWWSGLPVGEAKKGLEGVKPGLVCEKIGKKEFWQTAHTAAAVSEDMLLLCGFDEYLLGYQKRDEILDPLYAQKVCPGGNGVFFPMIVQAGQVIGTWKRSIKKEQVIITRDPFTPLTQTQAEAFEAAARRYAAFLGLEVVLA